VKQSLKLAAEALCVLIGLSSTLSPADSAAHAHKSRRVERAPAAKKPEPAPKPLPTVKVTVTNSRPATLLELRAGVSGSGKMHKVLGALRPGKEAVARLPRGAACEVDLHGAFDDGQTLDSTGVDICADTTVNLSD
jgi:hypothetical protein